jgi:hypothetical protein
MSKVAMTEAAAPVVHGRREHTAGAGIVDRQKTLHHRGGAADLVAGDSAAACGESGVQRILDRIGRRQIPRPAVLGQALEPDPRQARGAQQLGRPGDGRRRHVGSPFVGHHKAIEAWPPSRGPRGEIDCAAEPNSSVGIGRHLLAELVAVAGLDQNAAEGDHVAVQVISTCGAESSRSRRSELKADPPGHRWRGSDSRPRPNYRLSRVRCSLRNLATLGAITIWQ